MLNLFLQFLKFLFSPLEVLLELCSYLLTSCYVVVGSALESAHLFQLQNILQLYMASSLCWTWWICWHVACLSPCLNCCTCCWSICWVSSFLICNCCCWRPQLSLSHSSCCCCNFSFFCCSFLICLMLTFLPSLPDTWEQTYYWWINMVTVCFMQLSLLCPTLPVCMKGGGA